MIGPHGMSAAVRAASHASVDRAASRSAISGRKVARAVTRSPFVANRGSSASSGAPIAAQKRGHCRSDPTATTISPSLVANVSYGTMFGWALPRRPGARPGGERVLRLVDEHRQGGRQQGDVDALAAHRTVGAASQEPGEDPDVANSPATMSLIATPTLVGWPPSASASPVMDISPPTAWITKS